MFCHNNGSEKKKKRLRDMTLRRWKRHKRKFKSRHWEKIYEAADLENDTEK